jgi:hypothetical protein
MQIRGVDDYVFVREAQYHVENRDLCAAVWYRICADLVDVHDALLESSTYMQ